MIDTLHDYQIVGREFLRGRPQAGLFLDMGLGKTAITLSALEPHHLPVLVVAPKRVAENVWHAEVAKWRPDLTITVVKGDDPTKRRELLRADTDIHVIGRDNLRDVQMIHKGGVRTPLPYKTIVIDELSNYKTRASVRWKAMRKIVTQPSVEHVWGLTGTPSPNGMMDLWAQVGLLDGGKRLGRTITQYREAYFSPQKEVFNAAAGKHIIPGWDVRPGCDKQIMVKIEDICLSMQAKGRIKLPPVTYNDITTPVPQAVKDAYKKINDTLVVDLRDIFGGEIHSADSAAILTSKLSQIAAGFIFEDPKYDIDEEHPDGYQTNPGAHTWLHDETINLTKDIVDSIDSPVIVFYRFLPEREHLLAAFGDQAHTADEKDLQERWNKGEFPVLISHPASIGHGLNMQYGGHHEVWTSPTWELELWQQGIGRLARQGQTEPVVIHSVMRDLPIDALIRRRLDGKATVQDDLMAYLESPV